MQITIRRGRDLKLPGEPVQEVKFTRAVRTAALVGSDLPDVRPDFAVEVGDRVSVGQALFVDRRRPELTFCAPISGRVSQLRRGPRRALDLIAIEREDADGPVREFRIPSATDKEGVRRLLLEAGQWPAFRTRPFERIPEPNAQPAAIFVTAIDTEPLCANPNGVLRQEIEPFRIGLEALRQLTEGAVFVCLARGAPAIGDIDRVQAVEFAGSHPAGLPGTHIHHLMPVGRIRSVWHIGYQDVIAIGRLFGTGRIWAERIVSVAGPAVRDPCLVCTTLGADLNDLVAGNAHTADIELVSGSLLSGRPARYLGRYHLQVAAMAPGKRRNGQGILARIADAFGKRETAAIIPVAAHESVMALDIAAVPLLRALSVGDSETAERLGCLELAETDVALLTHVCPSGVDYAPLLRGVLEEIEQ